MTRYTGAYESGFLARFTATVASAVPEFDPMSNPIGHALAIEIFTPAAELALRPEPVADAFVGPAVDTTPAVAADEVAVARDEVPALDDTAHDDTEDDDTADETFGDLVELPMAVSPVEWFGTTTEPDEEADELGAQVLRAG